MENDYKLQEAAQSRVIEETEDYERSHCSLDFSLELKITVLRT